MTDLAAVNEAPRQARLAQLGLASGEKIRLEVRALRQRVVVPLLGFKEHQSLMVGKPRMAPGAAVLHEGTRFMARMMHGNYLCTFETRLIQVQTRPFGYWHLEYPEWVELRRVRRHSRVGMVLSVRVEPDDPVMLDSSVAQTAICRDISLSGARLESARPLGQPGEQVFVTARVSVAGMVHLLLLPALLRSVTQSESGVIDVFSHGVEFVDLEEETRLVLAGFVYEQQLLGLGMLEDDEV
ncbi:PilZ domain-containing protein [Marinobacterium weihaiense]|uniref:Flagellar brake protein n=1 Tax=Marinobacterium weihaiense TaxID=2851016 RepID=A0ABS6MB77_9GAMM|nr:PilZ domain-containing protein [Marinobacterium weihaiense]MBV0933561.1 flagellar brake protein [Marinobacterium weihaiense]